MKKPTQSANSLLMIYVIISGFVATLYIWDEIFTQGLWNFYPDIEIFVAAFKGLLWPITLFQFFF
jgi:hypothetical protein